jgi:hypothetical protein
MRRKSGGVIHLAEIIKDDLEGRDTELSKPQAGGLADIAAAVLITRSVNTSELANVLPRDVKSNEERYRFINRWLSNKHVDPIKVMSGFIPEIISLINAQGQIAILSIDQSNISGSFECLMVSLRIDERSIPVAWRVVETKGEIGFDIQEPLLKEVTKMIPCKSKLILMADRFYGTAALIALCQSLNWHYRIRLKSNLILYHQGGELVTGELLKLGLQSITGVKLNSSNVVTNIGVLQEEGHPEPWIIAMDAIPSVGKVLDYGMRWGIESLFSDLKTRGFDITKTQLRHADRIERLILVLTIAFFWAVSTGMQPPERKPQPSKKRATRSNLFL